MEVLTSKNRMSANTFLSLYFSKNVNTGLFNGLANKDFCITYYIALGFVLLCVTPFFLQFTTNIQRIFGHVADTIKHTHLSITQVFGILYQWYTLWQELRQLQPTGQ